MQPPSYLFKETRINLDSALPESTVILRLPALGVSRSSRALQKRSPITEVATAEDENAYKSKHLASAASVYHRQHHRSPKSFLWRILEDGKALSITAVDLYKLENEPENPLTLRLYFSSAIRPGCIAFSDPQEHDILSVYALTESNHLYTLTLRPDYFRRRASTEDNVEDWCKVYLSSAFSFKYPHRLVAPQHGKILISLHDGGLLRLNRQSGEDASVWKETFYNEGGWTQGLRSLIPFQGSNAIKHGKVNIELSAATAIEAPAVEIEGESYAFTISLDHRLRVWNLDSGKIAYTGDILGVERQPTELGKWVIHPSQSQLIRIIQESDERTIIITFSPHGAGEFKFWTMLLNGDGSVELIDMFPDCTLKPLPPTTDVWTMADFSTTLSNDEKGKVSLWILWKNNITYRVQTVDLQLLSPKSTESSWRLSWSAVAVETLPDTSLPALLSSDPMDCTEKWLNHIMYPGKYTAATLETALAIYERSLGDAKKAAPRTKNIAERMCSIIGSTATLTASSNGQMDYEQFGITIDSQWRRFYRLIVELDKQRGEALSLTFDSADHIPTVATADGLSVIRDCSSLERLWHNPDNAFGGRADSVSRLISAAAAFRENFSEALQHACSVQLRVELFQDPSLTEAERLRSFYDRCNFAGQIGDDDFNQLLANLGGSFKDVSVKLFEALLSTMTLGEDFDGRLERNPLANYGRKIAVKGVQEIVELHRSICLDQLVLLAFIEGEVDQDEEGMVLDTATVHRQLMNVLKRLEMLSWLCQTQISIVPLRTERADVGFTDSPSSKRQDDLKTVTVLEGTLNHLLGLVAHSGTPTSSLITELVVRVCDPNSDIELQPALIQAFLVKTERAELALSFSRFCSQDPFSTYIQGRAYLAAKELTSAATYFKKAAFGLAHAELHSSDRHSSSLLDDSDWNLLHAGLPSYYSHIVSLFDNLKAHSYVVDFARLALQFLPAASASKSSGTPSKGQKVVELQTDILSRLFSAALHTARYDLACSALHLIGDSALKSSYLRALVAGMCNGGAVGEMLELPWVGCEGMVDEVLAQKAQAIVDVTTGVPWHMILYSWRIRRGDFRGAAAVAYERLQKLHSIGNGAKNGHALAVTDNGTGDDLDTPITKQYLQVINTLSCVAPDEAWILAEPVGRKSGLNSKRKVVKLEDIRKGLQEEMDRVEALRRGRFSFVGGDEDAEMAM